MSQFHEHNKKISIEQLSKDRTAVTMDGRGVTQTPASTIISRAHALELLTEALSR